MSDGCASGGAGGGVPGMSGGLVGLVNIDTVRVDPLQIEQVILNLARNAIGAMAEVPPGQRRLLIQTSGGDGSVEISVRDSGPGLGQELLSVVFNPFVTTKPPGQGTGLGLSMSYDIIVNGHGGSLTCNSSGRGAEFVIVASAASK